MTLPKDNARSGIERRFKRTRGHAPGNRHRLTCLHTFFAALVLFLQFVYGQLDKLGRRVHQLENRLDRLGATVERQRRQCDEHFILLAACQQDTAKALNREIEQHALHPAIKAVGALAEELSRLEVCAIRLLGDGTDGGQAGELRNEIEISCGVAREKLAALDVQMITPAEGAELDAKHYEVCGSIQTADQDRHGRIGKLVTPGITYRGKVLRQARVLVFRFEASRNQQ